MTDQNGWLDVAIVGGGVSGVYAGWRLLTAGEPRPSDVTVFEAGDHVGGRLLSVPAPGIPNMVAELGGMRILPAVQPRIGKLLQVLKDDYGKNIETYPFPVDQPENISYLRGVHLRLSDFGQAREPAPWAQVTPHTPIPYRLRFLEQNQTPGQILTNAIEQIVPGITAQGLSEYERREMARRATFDGKPLWEQGFWNVLMRVISGEAYMLGIDAGGYQTTMMNWNAADAIPWYLSDFGVDPKYLGFKRGFQEVPRTVGELFVEAGGKVQLDTKVLGFTPVEGGVEIRFEGGRTARARRLVLGLPRRSLDLIAPDSPFLNRDEVRRLVHSVTPRPLFKLFTTYAYPWWCPAGVRAGRTTTDLPVRQTYYWPTDQGQPATRGPAMLMASYDDGTNIGFWDGFRAKRGRGWRADAEGIAPPKAFRNQDPADPQWEKNEAPEDMVEEVQRQLAVVHGLSFVPEVRNAAFRDWGDDPFGGGWNSWNIGVQSDQVQKEIAQPDAGVPVYICGEAYSDAQGWVEGALQSTDRALQKLGVPPFVAEGL